MSLKVALGNAPGTNAADGKSMCVSLQSAGDVAEPNTAAKNASENRGQVIAIGVTHRLSLLEYEPNDHPAFSRTFILLCIATEHCLTGLRGF